MQSSSKTQLPLAGANSQQTTTTTNMGGFRGGQQQRPWRWRVFWSYLPDWVLTIVLWVSVREWSEYAAAGNEQREGGWMPLV